mgnify:CR=1 FL=1
MSGYPVRTSVSSGDQPSILGDAQEPFTLFDAIPERSLEEDEVPLKKTPVKFLNTQSVFEYSPG